MEEEFFILGEREEGEEDDSEDGEDNVAGTQDNVSNLATESPECSSNMERDWGSLADVCLRRVFEFLPDRDRTTANLVCQHWHHVMRSPSLWRHHFFHFRGQLSRHSSSEYNSAIVYARTLGVYLQHLEVHVRPPRRFLSAQQLERVIKGLLTELKSVNAPIRSLSFVKLELDLGAWSSTLRKSVVQSLIDFIRRHTSPLTCVCLREMRNTMAHGLKLLSTLSTTRFSYHQNWLSTLDLKGFFSTTIHVHVNSRLPVVLCRLQGLTVLSLNYCCLSNELLLALQPHRHTRQYSRVVSNTLQRLSLFCNMSESHHQLVSGSSWASLASSCPDLKVKLRVYRVINTECLEGVLQPEIPLTELSMTVSNHSDEEWSAKPILCNMLPQYRHCLQYLSLDLSNCNESLDEELLELVKVCECLTDLTIWAFLEISTVGQLLHIRLTQRRLLNKIRVRIYSLSEHIGEEVILLSSLHLPPELEFSAKICTFEDQ